MNRSFVREQFRRGVATLALLPLATLSGPASAGPNSGDWGPADFTGLGGGCPIESRSGNELFVAGVFGGGSLDVYYYSRQGRAGMWGDLTQAEAPVSLPGPVRDFCPTPLPGKALMFVSDRPGWCGEEDGAPVNTDIYVSYYNPGKDAWSEPRHLGCAPDGPNTPGFELSPSVVQTAEGTKLFFSTGSGIGGPGAGQDLYESEMRLDGSFSEGAPIVELNTAANDRQPNVGRNGLEIVFASDRDADGVGDIWTATRDSVSEPWSAPVNLSDTVPFSTAGFDESRPSFSWDGKRLYYGSGGVYVSTRKPGEGPE